MIAFLERWLLTIFLLVPLAGGGAVLFIRNRRAAYWTALGVALSALLLSLLVLVPFRWSRGGEYGYGPGGTVRMVLAVEWVPPLHAEYRVGIDGLSFPFLVLTTFLTTVALLSAGRTRSPPRVYATMLLFECAVLGTFVAFDLLLLFLFTAFMLLPATWLAATGVATPRRSPAPKLFAYLLAGLVCLLVMMLGEYGASRQALGGSFDLVQLASAPMQRQFLTPQMGSASRTLFALAMVAFLVRLPVVPLHSWILELVSDAPVTHALLPAALIPATGVYGLLRVAYPLFPAAGVSLGSVLAILALVSIFYGGLCALGEEGLRRTIGYAAVSIVGFALLGASRMSPAGAGAAVYVSLFAALGGAMLLLALGARASRVKEAGDLRAAETSSGSPLQTALLSLAWFFWLVTPGLLGQALVVLAIFDRPSPWSFAIGVAASVGVMLTGAYVIAAGMRSATPRSPVVPPGAPAPAESIEIGLIAVVVLALGIVPGAMCFTFTRPALEALFRSLAY